MYLIFQYVMVTDILVLVTVFSFGIIRELVSSKLSKKQ
jgi:hypothetical protein